MFDSSHMALSSTLSALQLRSRHCAHSIIWRLPVLPQRVARNAEGASVRLRPKSHDSAQGPRAIWLGAGAEIGLATVLDAASQETIGRTGKGGGGENNESGNLHFR
jgi:hypothetical protein